jgi:nucleotide-binding universal stress UspA family protein
VVKISKILVAVDGSENADRAFEYAAYIAKQCEVERLFIINVIEGLARNRAALEKHDLVVKDLEHNS